jgi:two-component system CheB/CheR fusion protein
MAFSKVKEAFTTTERPTEAPAGVPDILEFDERRCKALMSVLTSIVWITDPEGRFVSPQPSWSAYTGQAWPEQEGFGWFQAVHEDDRADVSRCLQEAQSRRSLYRAKGRLWHAPSQTWRHVQVRGVPLLRADGTIEEWVGTCRDVDEQRRAEAVLRESDRRKDEFIATLAHELRNPLAPIRNAVQVLKMRGTADMQLTWARGIIERQVAQMAHLLDDLLDVSRISQNKVDLHKTRITLDTVLDTAIEVSRPHWEQNGQKFELSMLTAPIFIDADPARLAQVFTNLLNNACKYTGRGGRITMTVRREEDEALIDITDTGIGISPRMLPGVFELFSQDSTVLERSQGGLGIGLSIVRSLVEMHGGSVSASSEGDGKGSTFSVRLPAASRRGADASPALDKPTSDRPKLKVLVADDNTDAAETLEVLLNMLGHDARVAADGEEAIAVADAFKPDVALLDIGMPKKNGYEVARILSQTQPKPLLVALTGWGQPDDVRRAQECGFEHHLVKPVNLDKLTALLDERAAGGSGS